MKVLRLAAAAGSALLVGAAAAVQIVQAATPAVDPAAQADPSSARRAAAAPIVANGAWTVYHHDDAHTGLDSTQPTASTATTGWVSGTFDQSVYGSPLIYNGIVYVATLNNTLYALNQSDGSTIWFKHLRAPETTGWGCGNVSPQGIIGTPVIDQAGGRIYVATLDTTDDLYRLEGLNLVTGNEELNTVITTPAGSSFDWRIEQQRGALGIRNGYVYVPFGGRAGDCGAYHGFIFAVPINGTAVTHYYVTPGQGAGFWTAGGIVIDDSTGKVFDSSGNGTASGCNANPDGTPAFENDAIVRLSSTLVREDAFVPQDWQANWCNNDQDLGSASMVLISPTLAFQSGKWGNGFLVNPQSLGGLGGQLYPTPKPATYGPVDVCFGNHSDASFGSYAYAAPFVYLSCDHNGSNRGGLAALNVNTATPSFSACDATCGGPSWHTGDRSFGPPIVAGGAVWVVDQGGAGLFGFNAATGAQIFSSAGFGTTHFTTPSEAGGQIFVGSGNVVREFNLVTGCSGVMLGVSPSSPQPTGSTVLLTASGVQACASPVYRFWVRPPGGSWTVVRDYSASGTFSWSANGPPGAYGLEVDVRDASSTAAYDSTANIPYTLSGCTGAAISASPPSPQQPGPTVVVTGSASCTSTASYRFWTQAPGAAWVMAQDYSTANTYNWPTAALGVGGYGLEVDVRNQGSATSYESKANATYNLAVGVCSTPTLTASPPSPSATGTSVTFSSSTANCPNPRYRFWIRAPGGPWLIKQDYSPTSSYNWTGTGVAGSYGVEVDVRDAAESVSYDAVTNIAQQLNPCSAVSLGTNPNSPHYPTGSVVLTGTGTCPGTPTYRFWVRTPSGPWAVVQDYSTTNTFTWSIAGQPLGSYGLEVDVRDQGGTDSYEKVSNLTYVLQAVACTTPTLGASPVSPEATGSTITFTATTTACSSPRYRFWVQAPGAGWVIQQDYGTANTFSWTGTGRAGSYGIEVDVRDTAESVSYDAVKNLTYVLNGCGAASITASPPGSTAHGAPVAFTASATCPGTPTYRFWVRAPGGPWTVAQDYGTLSTFNWTNSTAGTYSIEVDVRDSGGTDTYEKVANTTYVLT